MKPILEEPFFLGKNKFTHSNLRYQMKLISKIAHNSGLTTPINSDAAF